MSNNEKQLKKVLSENPDPSKWSKWIKFIIAVLSALAGIVTEHLADLL